MNDYIKQFQDSWNENKKRHQMDSPQIQSISSQMEKIAKENSHFYYNTLIILTITWTALIFFFSFVAPVNSTIGRTGVALMLISLMARIVAEIYSIRIEKKIVFLETTLSSLKSMIQFHQYRKWIHHILSPIIIVIYSVGFYLLTPEFLRSLPNLLVWGFDLIYVIIALILFFTLKKEVNKEIKHLQKVINLKESLVRDK